MERRAAINRLYDILSDNIAKRGRHEFSTFSSSRSLYSNPDLNQPGIYFIFEPTEFREDGVTQRVVYIGITKTGCLFTRLERHSRDSDESNWHGYVFEAVARSEGKVEFTPFFSKYWNEIPDVHYVGMRAFEFDAVLPSIRKMSCTWLPVSEQEMRHKLERGAIALLSNLHCADQNSAVDAASSAWLGSQLTTPCAKSGLWNRNHIGEQALETSWLDELEKLVGAGAGPF